jgi:hypothetical protein
VLIAGAVTVGYLLFVFGLLLGVGCILRRKQCTRGP